MITAPRHTALLLSFVLAGVSGACQSTPRTPPAPAANTWATVNGRDITRDEVEKVYRRTAQLDPAPSEEEAMTAKLGILNEYIVQELLIAKAGTLKIEATDAEVDTAFKEGRQDIPEEAFQQELTRRNLTADDMRTGLRRDLLVQKVMEREVTSKITVTDQEVSAFFEANRAQFNRTEDAYRIAQIVITPVRDPEIANRANDDATTPQEAAGKAQMLLERLKSGASFGELAADYSEDPQSAPRGGDLGFVPISALRQAPAQLRDAVLKATPGQVTTVSQGGAHTLVLLVAKDDAGQKDLSMPPVKDGITQTLKSRKEQLLRAAYLSAVRNEATVVNHLANRLLETQGQVPSLAPAAPGAQ